MRCACVLALVLVASACTQPKGTYVSPGELADIESQQAAAEPPTTPTRTTPVASASTVDEGDKALEKKRGYDERRRKLDRRREDHARDRANLEDKRRRMALQQESAEASETIKLEAGDRDMRNAGQDLDHFTEVLRARRIAEDDLELAQSADRLTETREELAQLEMMYDESELGDATAEIVLARTRRRLVRAEERHALREAESGDLRTLELPREEETLRAKVVEKMVALDNVKREVEAAELQRTIDRRDLEQDTAKLDREANDIEREGQELEQDIRLWETRRARGSAGS